MLKFFDCNASYGRLDVPPIQYAATPTDLVAEMDFCGVAEALVTCAAQRCDSPLVGNELVIEETRDQPRLHPAWVLLPPQSDEQAPTVDQFLTDMRQAGVKALWVFPARNKFLLNATTFGAVFETLIERSIPVFYPLEEAPPAAGWQQVDTLLADFPQLTLVAANHNVWGQDRYFRPLIERYPRLYLDIAAYEQGRGLEDFCRRYGAERLLFGTRYPEVPMGGPMLNVAHADISPQDRELIASGNLSRLLQEVKL